MRTDEDFRRLEAENRLLRERLDSAPEIADDLKRAIAGFLVPRGRQRPEERIALRVLASKAGVPSLCGRRECRRDRTCHAEANPPYCREHWPRNLFARFEDMALGIELSAFAAQQEAANFHAWACEQLGLTPEGTTPRKKRSRKSADA